MSSENSKKQFIDALIERVYQNDKVKHIFTENLDELQKSAEDKYLSSNLSMDEIADKIMKDVEEKRNEYDKKAREASISNLTEQYYKKYKDLFNSDLEELKKESIDKYLNTELTIEEINNDMFARVKKAYDEKEGKKEVQDKDENTMSTTNDNNRPAFAGLLGTIGGVTAGPQGYNTEPSTVVENNTELSAMLAEPINKEESSEKINQDMNLVDPPKQLVKTSQENNSKDSAQVGSISLFSVVLSILIVTSIILLAMILNILLK